MIFNCMYGAPHAGDAVAVRGKVGNTAGWLCATHYQQHQKTLLAAGYHFRTREELEARGELNGGKDKDERTATGVDQGGSEEQQQPEHGDSGWDTESLEPTPERHTPSDTGWRPHGGAQIERPADHGRQLAARYPRPAPENVETLPSREIAESGRLPDPASRPSALTLPDWPAWAEGAGHLTLSPEQRAILQRPFEDREITIRYDGVVYAPWRRYWSRMCEAFSPFVPAVIPVGEPKLGGQEIVVGVVMTCGGVFIGKAWGSHRLEGANDKMSAGDRIESAISDAISKIGKRLNMAEDLWDGEYLAYWKATYAEQYTNRGRTSWRRRPMPKEEGDDEPGFDG